MATSEFVTRVRQFVCGLQGHENLLAFGRGRLSLKCMSCGHETPGWEIKIRNSAEPPPADAPVRRPRMLTHLARARRLA